MKRLTSMLDQALWSALRLANGWANAGRLVPCGAVAVALVVAPFQPEASGVELSIGDTIKLDWSTAGDGDGGDLSDWNQTDDGQSPIIAGAVIRHGDAEILDGVSIGFQNAVAGNFNNDPGSDDPVFLPNDPFFVEGADDIYFHGDGANNLITTFGGLNPDFDYDVRVYNSLNRDPDALITTHDVNGIRATVGEFQAWSATNLEDSGLVFPNVVPTAGGEVAIELIPVGAPFYPLQAMILTAVAPDRLELVVDPVNGQALLRKPVGVDLDVKGYAIRSESGALLPEGWNSLQTQGFDGGNSDPLDGVGWEELGEGSANAVAEFNLQGSSLFGPSGSTLQALGDQLFDTNGLQDLVLEVSLADGSRTLGLVTYEPIDGVPGDFNNDDVVNAADYTIWRDNLGADAGTLPNDPTGAPIGQDQYDLWVANFGQSLPMASAVPEPSSVIALLVAAACVLGRATAPRP